MRIILIAKSGFVVVPATNDAGPTMCHVWYVFRTDAFFLLVALWANLVPGVVVVKFTLAILTSVHSHHV